MSELLSEQDFRLQADRALERVHRTLAPLADEADVEVDLRDGVLQIAFEEPSPAKFVVSPNAPVRQIWVSALSRSYKLPWSPAHSAFVLNEEPLDMLVQRLVQQHLAS
jgi:iron donor protein CyaY